MENMLIDKGVQTFKEGDRCFCYTCGKPTHVTKKIVMKGRGKRGL